MVVVGRAQPPPPAELPIPPHPHPPADPPPAQVLADRGRLKRSATIWASGRTRDPYFEILGAPRGIMVTPSVDFDY